MSVNLNLGQNFTAYLNIVIKFQLRRLNVIGL